LKKHAQATDLGLIDLRLRLDQQHLDESRGLFHVRVEDLAFCRSRNRPNIKS